MDEIFKGKGATGKVYEYNNDLVGKRIELNQLFLTIDWLKEIKSELDFFNKLKD